MTLHSNKDMSDSQRCPVILYLINIVNEIVVFLASKVFNFHKKPVLEIINFQKENNWYFLYFWADKAWNGTGVIWTCQSTIGESCGISSLNTRFNILYFVFYIQISRQNSTCSNSSSSRRNISREPSGIVQSWSLQGYPPRMRLKETMCAFYFLGFIVCGNYKPFSFFSWL